MQYRSPWGEARIGRILEDLDSLTALVAFEHWWVLAGRLHRQLCRTACKVVLAAPTWLPADSAGLRVRAIPPPTQSNHQTHTHTQASFPTPTTREAAPLLPSGSPKHPTPHPPHPRSDVSDERARPPLLVTAGVEAIELHSSRLSMRGDMTVRAAGRRGQHALHATLRSPLRTPRKSTWRGCWGVAGAAAGRTAFHEQDVAV